MQLFLMRPATQNYEITHERKFQTQQNTQQEKFWTHEIPTIKKLGPKKYSPENILDPRNTHEKKI